jgi:hypothetical protein
VQVIIIIVRGDRSIDGLSTVREFIDLLDKQQQEEIRRLIEKLTADTSIDGVSTGRRSIDSSSSSNTRRLIDRSTTERSIDSINSTIDRSTATTDQSYHLQEQYIIILIRSIDSREID